MKDLKDEQLTVVIDGEHCLLRFRPIVSRSKDRKIYKVTLDNNMIGTAFRLDNMRCKAVGKSGREYGGSSIRQAAVALAYGECKK